MESEGHDPASGRDEIAPFPIETVVVHDLSGRLVWHSSTGGAELIWHTEDLQGRSVANGIYLLYQVQVKVFGSWVSVPLQRLAVFR